MNPFQLRWRSFLAGVCLACPLWLSAQQQTPPTKNDVSLTKEEIRKFLLTAEVIGSQPSSKGVTHPLRLTLSDGRLTHDASFQPINEHKPIQKLESGRTEIGFVDAYRYNLAAYGLAELLGVDDMLPVYVERKWHGKSGSLSWWLPVKMDEEERLARKVQVPPEATDAWNKQMHRIRVFDELVYDPDPNLTNVLIGEDWKIWRIDFTRGFRMSDKLNNPRNLVRCDRRMFEKLQALTTDELSRKTNPYLTKSEVKAVMARRDKIVTYFQKLIADKGESEVLY